MKGTYILVLLLSKSGTFRVGKLGELEFKQGYYAYVGSALNNLEARIRRHLKVDKRLFWHIDYLLQFGETYEVYYELTRKRSECKLANKLYARFESIKRFGSSDCKCNSHLFFSTDKTSLLDAISSFGMNRYNVME